MRLDVWLTEHGIYKSRTRAAGAVKSGCVSLDGKTIVRPSYELDETDASRLVCLPDPLEYVGRGALKLEYALERFGIDVAGMTCVDLGASTGGFTQVLLKRGAASVTAVDVGHGQLDSTLRDDPRVTTVEGCDARAFTPPEGQKFDFLCMDLSFISIRKLRDKVAELLAPGGCAVVLFKPQFEVGRGAVGKGGIVRDAARAQAAMFETTSEYESAGLVLRGQCESPVKGGDGNTEYRLFFRAGAVRAADDTCKTAPDMR